MLLKDKIAVITGIGPGAGQATAVAFATQGAKVVIGARNEEYIQKVAGDIEAEGGVAVAIRTDLADHASCEHIVSEAVQRFGGVDILVQNGHDTGDMAMIADADVARWREAIEVNLFGALHLFKAALPSMKQRGDGRVILVNSGAANNAPPPYLASYGASKAALASLVRSIATEYGPDGIRCNSVHYGPIDGDNFRPWLAGLAEQHRRSFEEELALYCEQEFPLRYVPTAEECAGTVVYLASDLARVVTGQSLSVNGGQWFGK
ncbi:SDR family oxidoreductase [Haliea sp. E1-2-M8]|uniref:SDR family oxidoreductase n=1 Tax=Haliea sp. E1-2-M8 TaxID=3064706 RepID=UPI002723F2D9|nr:SDR family oxidoreductase [Haliea sp. E1-2-M8]MDO8863028.1 SDR family oxidoreductase [Haliea sp. E1-2-M8]